jgi:HSP20 family protein
MALPVRENSSPLTRMHDEIDRMFKDFTTSPLWPRLEGVGRVPSVDVYEKDGAVVVEAEMPGVNKDDIHVSHTDSTVTIQGETKQEKEENKDGYYRSERQYGSFYRAIPLPAAVDFSNATAEFHDGVLRITLPKSQHPEEKRRTIPVNG